jgi:glycosyltransferase involved in cell wall biosynthesis
MAALPPDFSIVLPAYNEAPNVAPMLAAADAWAFSDAWAFRMAY